MGLTSRDEIIPLWPTWVAQARLPGCEGTNRQLETLASARTANGNLFESGEAAAAWLRARVEAAVDQWFERFAVRPAPQCRIDGRLESLGFGQYREQANAPGAYLAGLYFVNAPAEPELGHLRSDCRASHLTLFDPRVGFNMLAIEGDPNFDETRTLVPVEGTLMLWPGYLRHCSRVHLARSPWVRVVLRVDLAGRAATEAAR